MKQRRWPKGTWMKLNSSDTLKALIKQRHLSYSDVGEMAGCHRTMISQLANGNRTSCTPELAARIARCLDVPEALLFVAQASAGSGRNDKRSAA